MASSLDIIKTISVGQLLLIETRSELLMGSVIHVDTKNFMIELDDVRDIKTGFMYKSPQILAYQNMVSIKLIKETKEKCSEKTTTETDKKCKDLSRDGKTSGSPSSSSNSAVCNINSAQQFVSIDKRTEPSKEPTNQLTELDIKLIQTQLSSLVYITQADQTYHKALTDIRSQAIVGLLLDPIHTARHRRTSLIAISTPTNIYLFDILNLGNIFKDMRLILGSEKPRKAVHYSHRMVDHFQHQHNLELAGVFDTFVAYCLVVGNKSNKSFEEVVKAVFNISDIYFEPVSEENRPRNPFIRPLPQDYRLVIAKKVAFQLKLCEHLIHEQMLTNFYQQCQQFSQTFAHNNDGFKVAQQLHRDSTAGHECIQPDGNWKDKLGIDYNFDCNMDL